MRSEYKNNEIYVGRTIIPEIPNVANWLISTQGTEHETLSGRTESAGFLHKGRNLHEQPMHNDRKDS